MLLKYYSQNNGFKPVSLKLPITFLLSIFVLSGFGQLTTNINPTAEEVIQSFFKEGMIITNVEYDGEPFQMGSFDCQDCGIGIEEGFLMTNGLVENAEGPNHTDDESFAAFNPDDFEEDLMNLYADTTIEVSDVAILEFDFKVAGDSVSLDYVFGSEEYPEFVETSGQIIADPFGIFVSGPGISGEFSNGAKNIALIPGTDEPVVINNLNNGPNNEGPCVNCEHYISNPIDQTNIYNVQYDGYSTILTAGIGGLQVGEIYHMKIAIADASDQEYDTGVFFANQSLRSNRKFVSFNTESIFEGDSIIRECETAALEIVRTEPIENDEELEVNWNGDMLIYEEFLYDWDLEVLPTDTLIPAGTQAISIPLEIVNDELMEEMEILTVYTYFEFEIEGIGSSLLNAELMVVDTALVGSAPPNLIAEETLLLCNGEEFTITPNEFDYSEYDIAWFQNQGWVTLSTDSQLTINPLAEGSYKLQIVDECGSFREDEVNIELKINSELAIVDSNTTIVSYESVAQYQWLDCENGFEEIQGEIDQFYQPSEDGNYAVRITKGDCEYVTDCIEYFVIGINDIDSSHELTLFPNPTNDKITLRASGENQLSHYELFDHTGREVKEGKLPDQSEFSLTVEGAPGVYLLRVYNKKGDVMIRKVVKR